MYEFFLEKFSENCMEFYPLFKAHHDETMERFKKEGFPVSTLKIDLKAHIRAEDDGRMIMYTARHDGKPVGYAIVFAAPSMHDGLLQAREDALYVLPEHRNGTGRKLMKCVLADLKSRGVRTFYAAGVTDPRANKAWQRLGFKPVSTILSYSFED